jgi:hypothetical protein
VAKPYGHNHPYDFIVGGRKWLPERTDKRPAPPCGNGFYQVCISRHRDGIGPHTESEVDFIAAYIIPRRPLVCVPGAPGYRTHQRRISSQGIRPRRPYAHYREAWHLLREPDGLTFV